MAIPSFNLPDLGELRETEDVETLDTLQKLVDLVSGQIDAANIADGSLTNAEIAAGANVALAKLAIAPMARVFHSLNQNVPSPIAAVAFDSERYDSGVAAGFAQMHDNAVNNSRLAAPMTGIYFVFFAYEVTETGGTGETVELQIRRGDGAIFAKTVIAVNSGETKAGTLSTELPLTAGDFMELHALRTGAGAMRFNASGGGYQCEFGMSFRGRAS